MAPNFRRFFCCFAQGGADPDQGDDIKGKCPPKILRCPNVKVAAELLKFCLIGERPASPWKNGDIDCRR
jgi:hypothetical protein